MAFILSKVFWASARPDNLLLILLLAGLALTLAGRRRWGTMLSALAALSFLLLAVLPIGTWLLLPLEERFTRPEPMPASIDGIVLLGGAVEPALTQARGGVTALNVFAERFTAFFALARRYPEARLVFTGGSGALFPGSTTEADAARDLLVEQLGLPGTRVVWEGRSRNTHENATLALAAAAPVAGERWILVTSAMHMPRAMGAFRAAGWRGLLAYPSDYLTPPRPRLLDFDLTGGLAQVGWATHEWIGLLAYRVLGWSDALFPQP